MKYRPKRNQERGVCGREKKRERECMEGREKGNKDGNNVIMIMKRVIKMEMM